MTFAEFGRRLLRRPLLPALLRKLAKSYLHFAGALFLFFLLPQLVIGASDLLSPPSRGSYTASYAIPRSETSYRLLTSTPDGSGASAYCSRTTPANTTYRCIFSGDSKALGALLAEQWRDPRLLKTFDGVSEPDLRLTTITPPIWLLVLQLLILAVWYRANAGAWKSSNFKAWFPWIFVPLVVNILWTQAGQLLGNSATSAEFLGLVRDQLHQQPRTTVISVCILAPWIEELFFRGVGWNLLRGSFNESWTIILTALPFAAIHGAQYGISTLILLLLLGFLFGALRSRFRSVIPCVISHVLVNSFALLMFATS